MKRTERALRRKAGILGIGLGHRRWVSAVAGTPRTPGYQKVSENGVVLENYQIRQRRKVSVLEFLATPNGFWPRW